MMTLKLLQALGGHDAEYGHLPLLWGRDRGDGDWKSWVPVRAPARPEQMAKATKRKLLRAR